MTLTFALPLLVLLSGIPRPAPAGDPVTEALARPILPAGKTLAEIREFVDARIPAMPAVATSSEWSAKASSYRRDVLERVVLRGEAARWKSLPTKPEWVGEIDGGPGYRIKKLRFEVVPGLSIPALLYEPNDLRGKVPVVLVVNGHDAKGKAGEDKQILCINLARRVILAISLEWFGMGQLKADGFRHELINAVDLCGTSGIALHYLAMTRAIDVLLSHENADPSRVGVTGLSGGGWQTIFVSPLDTRVTMTDPVAGYSSFRTRLRELEDLGDSEQTPCDLATVVDYTHLTAMMAPHPTLLTFNAKDDCCFAAPHALPPLLEAVAPIFGLFGAEGKLRSHVNHDPGTHNYKRDNRQAFYQMISDNWSRADQVYSPIEIPSDPEIKTADALAVDLPATNLDFRRLFSELGRDLPRDPSSAASDSTEMRRIRLRSLVKPIVGQVTAEAAGEANSGDVRTRHWTIRMGTSWSVPAVELSKGDPKGTTILIADGGRAGPTPRVKALLDEGRRVVAVDLYGFGEAVPPSHGYLFSLMIGTVGERPLGVDCGQLIAVSSWRAGVDGASPMIEADGPRSSTIAVVAAALDEKTIGGLVLRSPLGSLKDVLDSGRSFTTAPELFCFGLLERFDLEGMTRMVAPRPVKVEGR